VLGYVAGSLVLEDAEVIEWFGGQPHPAGHPIQIALGVSFTLFGWWGYRQRVKAERARAAG
jgi:hypothetical protein